MIEKLIKKFQTYAIKEYSSDNLDYKNCNKCDAAMEDVLLRAEEENLTQELYTALFESDNPCVLRAVAEFSWENDFDVYKSLEIFKHLTKGKHIKFSDDEKINRKWIDNCKSLIPIVKEVIELYERINDDRLFKQYRKYLRNTGGHIDYWLNFKEKKSQECWEQAKAIVEEVKADGKLDKFFNLTFEVQDNAIKITNALISADIGYDVERSKKALKELMSSGERNIGSRVYKLYKENLEKMEKM